MKMSAFPLSVGGFPGLAQAQAQVCDCISKNWTYSISNIWKKALAHLQTWKKHLKDFRKAMHKQKQFNQQNILI